MTKTVIRTCLAALLLVSGSAFAQTSSVETEATPTQQAWQVCNETSFILRAALALKPSDRQAQSRGWIKLLPGACHSEIVLTNTERYVFAESSPAHQGGIREWTGRVELCASDADFESNPAMTCELQNLQTRPFLLVPAGENRTTFVEAADYGKKAEVAGMQRLLRDIGEKVTRIDGLTGRRTSALLRSFRKRADLRSAATNRETLLALEKAASGLQDEIGLTACNASARTVWMAIAHKVGKSVESKGWWSVSPSKCIRPFTVDLKGSGLHFYAVQEAPPVDPTDDNEVMIKALEDLPLRVKGENVFCISEARFSALGNTMCADNGYLTANFRAIDTSQMGAKITLKDQDFGRVDLR